MEIQERISEKLAVQLAQLNYEKTALEVQLENAQTQIAELNEQLEETQVKLEKTGEK